MKMGRKLRDGDGRKMDFSFLFFYGGQKIAAL